LGLDLGWVMVVWLAYILSRGDHRKVSVQAWVEAHPESLKRLTGIEMSGNDFNDDRLSILLRHLSQVLLWQGLEAEVIGRSIKVLYLERVADRDGQGYQKPCRSLGRPLELNC
jgi:transposase